MRYRIDTVDFSTMIRIALFYTFVLFYFSSTSQQIDLSGTWEGHSTFLKNSYKLRYEISQQGDRVFVEAKSVGKEDSVKSKLEGRFIGDKLALEAKQIIYKTGLACMSDHKLEYSFIGEEEALTGRWRGNAKLNTCPYVAAGSVTLIKIDPASESERNEIRSVDSNLAGPQVEDNLGKTLTKELGQRKYYALIIGIEKYTDSSIDNLQHPIGDALKLASVLTTKYSFDEEYLVILKNPTREEIIKALDDLARKVSEKDNLLIFYAGHGMWNAQLNQGYWLPSDASLDSKSYWLSNSTLRDYVGGIRSKHTLLISDACFSGGILKERSVFSNSKAILEMYKLPSRKAMTSGTLKTVPDRSVFIHYLVKSLENNTEPLLSADQLFRGFRTAVINNSPNGQVPQYGPISQAGDEGGDFIFLKR